MGERLSEECRCGQCRAAAAASPQGDADRGDLWDLADVLVSWGVPRERSIEAANAMTAAGYQQVPPGHHVVKTGEVVLDDGTRWEVEPKQSARLIAVAARNVREQTGRNDLVSFPAALRPLSEGGDSDG